MGPLHSCWSKQVDVLKMYIFLQINGFIVQQKSCIIVDDMTTLQIRPPGRLAHQFLYSLTWANVVDTKYCTAHCTLNCSILDLEHVHVCTPLTHTGHMMTVTCTEKYTMTHDTATESHSCCGHFLLSTLAIIISFTIIKCSRRTAPRWAALWPPA